MSSAGAADPGENRDLPGITDSPHQLRDGLGGGRGTGPASNHRAGRHCAIGSLGQDVAGENEHGRALLADGILDGCPGYAHDLVGMGNRLRVIASLREQGLGLGFLKIPGADLTAGNLRRQCEYRGTGAVGIHDPLDEVGIARTAAPGAYRQAPRELRVG